jgi:predicted hotdog family 3-hydroxylacyl-ACP dehydratase
VNSNYSNSKTAGWQLEDLVLHRGPMLLLNRVLEVGDEHMIAEVDVTPEQIYCDPVNGVPAWVGVEYMAQAAAALSGTWNVRNNEPVRLGLLIGCRRYTSKVPAFSPGSVLQVHARLMLTLDDELAAFDCEILDGAVIASGQLTAYSGAMDPK